MKETILFVDDDINLLQGLQRMLRVKRNEWDMTFISSPLEAIDLMKKRCFDVVVADMRMPEMDGADLLTEVKKICPCSVRIILSGQADLDMIIKSVSSTHQYLSKPCDPDVLQAVINRASKLRKIMGNRDLEQFVSQLQSIPSRSHLYELVEKEMNSDNPSIEKISGAVSQDIGMSTKVLQLTNSTFFGQKGEVLSPQEAVYILGVETMKRLFSSGQVFSKCETGLVGTLDIERLHTRGMSVGNFAMRVATIEGLSRDTAEMCSCTGLLCRLGCLILGLFTPEKHRQVLQIGEECDRSVAMEMELFGTTHSEIGGYLLGLWGLPNQLVEAASHHHECQSIENRDFSILTALQIAEHLASATKYETGEMLETFEGLAKLRDKYC